MYKIKYYCKDGTIENTNQFFDKKIINKNITNKYLKDIFYNYPDKLNKIYKIEVLENDKIKAFYDDSIAIINGKNGHVTYDDMGNIVGGYYETDDSDKVYRFKFYYDDGTVELGNCKVNNPLKLFNDFDGLIEWNEFDSLSMDKLTTHKVLEIAVRAYKTILPSFYKIEIINDKTKTVVDFILVNNKKAIDYNC